MIGMSRGPLSHGATNGMVTTRRRHQNEPKKQQSQQFDVDYSSFLRIRPLLKNKEKEDHVVLEKARQPTVKSQKKGAVAVLHPPLLIASPGGRSADSPNNFIHEAQEQDFHFDKVLDTGASQESVFYAMGLSMASTAMEPLKKNSSMKTKSSVVIGMGVKDSGKTHTLFGKVKMGTSHEGLLPRVIDSLFSQSKHHISSSKSFGVRMTLLQVENDEVVKDLLLETRKQPTPKSGGGNKASVMAMVASFEKPEDGMGRSDGRVTIEQDPETFDFVAKNASNHICKSAADARDLLQAGLARGQASRLVSFGGKGGARGHVLISLQPVLIGRSREIERFGGTICMVDLASLEQKGKKKNRSGQMKDIISTDSSLAALMHCFRTIKHNKQVLEGRSSALDIVCEDDVSMDGSDISCVSDPKSRDKPRSSLKAVPWRQSKVTMLLQPLFSTTGRLHGHDGTTQVSLLMTAYPGHRDYAEKRSIMKDLEMLHGHEIGRQFQRKVETGLQKESQEVEQGSPAAQDISLSYSSSFDEEEQQRAHVVSRKENKPPTKRLKTTLEKTKLPVPSAPLDASIHPSPSESTAQLERLSLDSQSSAPLYVNDFPGVTQPTPTAALQQQQRSKFSSPPMMNPSYSSAKLDLSERKAPVRALVSSVSKANIQPPADKPPQKKSSWMANAVSAGVSGITSTPVKTLSSAVNAGVSAVSAGKRQIETMTKSTAAPSPSITTTRNGLTRMASEYEISEDACQEALRRRVTELERQNNRLVDRNMKLEEKCDQLQQDKKKLETQVREAGRENRQKGWTDQDEKEWRHSRQIRHRDQTLIHSPLQNHLDQVEATYQIGHKWLESGKTHFDLSFPKWWKGARELNDRDNALMLQQPEVPTPFSTPNQTETPVAVKLRNYR